MAKNLSTVREMTPKNEALHSRNAVISNALIRSLKAEVWLVATFKGWTTKPTPGSETAKLMSNVFRVFGNTLVFFSAIIVKIFNIVAV